MFKCENCGYEAQEVGENWGRVHFNDGTNPLCCANCVVAAINDEKDDYAGKLLSFIDFYTTAKEDLCPLYARVKQIQDEQTAAKKKAAAFIMRG